MPHYEDLTPYTYQPERWRRSPVNVGWLAAGHPFPTGPVPEGFVERLARLAVHHPVNRTRGWQDCELCDADYPVEIEVDGSREPIGDAEIRVGGGRHRYAAPTLIVHYVAAHGYRPPDGFISAVMGDRRVVS